jgi:hypothetical protein
LKLLELPLLEPLHPEQALGLQRGLLRLLLQPKV